MALHGKGEILGLLLLGAPVGRKDYSDAEREALRRCGEQLTLMIENARLTSRVVEQEKLRRDLALAAEVQRRLLPDAPPERAVGCSCRRSACRHDPSAAITTIFSILVTSASESRSRTSPARASPPR